jgi:hypothetical protein
MSDPISSSESKSVLRPRPGVVARDMNGSAVLVHLDTNRIYELNATGARIWSLLEQGLDRQSILSQLCEEFAVPAADIEQEVGELLAMLESEGLIGV